MKVLIYGEYWPGTMAHLIERDLKDRAISTETFDFTPLLFRNRVGGLLGKVLDRVLWPYVFFKININFLRRFKKYNPNVVLISKGIHIFPSVLTKMRASGAVIVNWNPDDFANRLNNSKYLLKSLPIYDFIFCARPHLFDEYKLKYGAKECRFVDWYYEPTIHHIPEITPGSELERYACDVSFIGSWSKRREAFLSNLVGMNVRIWGANWEKSSNWFRKNFDVTDVILDARRLPLAVRSSKVNINILTAENRDVTNMKIFEIPACGGFLLTERTKESSQILVEGRDAFFFSSPSELRAQCLAALSDDELRTKVRDSGTEKIRSGSNNFASRMSTILKTLNSSTPGAQ